MPSTTNGGHSTQWSDLVGLLKEKKSGWEGGRILGPEDPDFRQLVEEFKAFSDLTEISLVGENLGDTIISALGRAMVEVPFPLLTSLQLGGNYVHEMGLLDVSNAIRLGHVPGLESLGLFPLRTANSRHRFVKREEARWITNRIKDKGVKTLASAFGAGHVTSLKVLTLERNGFGLEGARAIAQEIRRGHLPSLEILNLSDNDVGDEGIADLARAFTESGHHNQLQVLDLDTCNIFADGTRALASAFRSGGFPALTELYLGNNNNNNSWQDHGEVPLTPIDKGLIELASVLQNRQLPRIKVLDLQNNADYSTRVGEAFKNAVRSNSSLVTFIINWPSYENSVRRILEQHRRRAEVLEQLAGEPDVQATHGKVFLCGHPREGKTTLRRSLQKDWPAYVTYLSREKKKRDEPRTRGIEVSHIVSKGEKGEGQIRLAIWDLAGQSEYQVLHSAFLPDLAFADGQATTFVIVCNAKYPGSDVGGEHHGMQLLNYWMRFIASSSSKADERGKRHVILVLNRFDDEPCEYLDHWKKYLADLQALFHDYLDIEARPFVLDARVARSVRPLKEHLIQHTRVKLQLIRVPKICQFIQDTVSQNARVMEFPVLTWADFAVLFQGSVSDEKTLKTAVNYLHESGHLIYFRKGWEGASNEGSPTSGRSLVVLDPDWFCRRVVGKLLLPDNALMLDEDESPLTRRVLSDGSVALQDLKDYFRLLLPEEQQVSDIVAMLLRLGICYKSGAEKVLIPALISDNVGKQIPAGFWGHSVVSDQWVMGYCLKVQDRTTTLLPIAVFRRLQVELAQNPMCAAADADYKAGKFNITFGTNGMAVRVEFSANETDPDLEDRVDILVRPLVSRHQDISERREFQVELAQMTLDKFVTLAERWSPGVEFGRFVVKPWCTSKGDLPMAKRNVTLSVEEVKSRVQAGETTSAWTVDGELVTFIDLLSRVELRKLESSLGQKCDLVERLIVDLGFAQTPHEDNQRVRKSNAERPDLDQPFTTIIDHIDNTIGIAMEHIDSRMDELMESFEGVRKDLKTVLGRQKQVLTKLQALERFSRDEVTNSVPRFMYLTKARDRSGIWMTLKDIFVEKAILHFLCESHYNDHALHEVSDQEGVEIKNLTRLAAKVLPWLTWSLKVAVVVGKVASQAFLPGLVQLIGTFPGAHTDANITAGVAYLLSAILMTGAEGSPWNETVGTSSLQSDSSTPLRSREVKDDLKDVLSELIGEMTLTEFQAKFRLKRAVNEQGHILWICHDCFYKYNTEGTVESL